MAIFGIGAAYGGQNDVSSRFIDKGIACLGWSEKDAPTLHYLLKHIKTGDIIYIKAHPPNLGLIIKAVGIVIGQGVEHDDELGTGIAVKWVWSGDERFGQLQDRYAVRNLALYEEYNYDVQARVIGLLLKGIERN